MHCIEPHLWRIYVRPTTSNTTLLWKGRYFTAQTWQHAPAYRDLKSREIFPFLPVIDWSLRWEHGIDWHSDKGVIFPITGSKRLSAHPISSGTIRYCPWLHLASQEAALFMTACPPPTLPHASLPPPPPTSQAYSQPLYLPRRSTEGCDKFGAFKGNQQSRQTICIVHSLPPPTPAPPTNWGVMIEMLCQITVHIDWSVIHWWVIKNVNSQSS